MFRRVFSLFIVASTVLFAVGCNRNQDNGYPVENGYPAEGEGAVIGGDAQPVSEPGEQGAASSGSAAGQTGGSNTAVTTAIDLDPQPLPEPTVEATPEGGAFTPGQSVTHEVLPDEWLVQIARCYGADYTAVRKANPAIWNPNYILPHTKVTVPNVGSDGPIFGPKCTQRVTVAPGDTFYSLAKKYDTTVAILQRANPGWLLAGDEIIVPTNVETAVSAPTLTHDLLFNLDGDLALWRSANSELVRYADDEAYIIDLATNVAGDLVLVKQIVSGDKAELALVDMAAETIMVLDTDVALEPANSDSHTMLLSDDGAWAAYIAQAGDGYRLSTFATASPESRNDTAVALNTNDHLYPRLFLGSDNDTFLWSDGSGLYQYEYDLNAEGELLLAAGPEVENSVYFYYDAAWSPTGQYLLLLGGFIEGGASFVLDSATGDLALVPLSGSYISVAATAWQPDGSLVAFSPPQEQNGGPTRKLYTPTSDDGLALVEAESFTYASPEPVQPGGYLIDTAVYQASNDSTIAFINGRIYKAEADILTELSQMPAEWGLLNWAPDSTALILTQYPNNADEEGDIYYASLDGTPAYALSNWLGWQINSFHWLD